MSITFELTYLRRLDYKKLWYKKTIIQRQKILGQSRKEACQSNKIIYEKNENKNKEDNNWKREK